MLRWKNKPVLIYCLIGIGIYFFYLLASIPAGFVVHRFLPAGVSSFIQYQRPSGTLWTGQFERLSIKQIDLGKVNWQLSIFPLLWGSADLELNARRENMSLLSHASLQADQFEFENTELQFPVSDLMPLFYGWPLSLDGMTNAHFKNILIEPGNQFIIEGRAVLTDINLIAPQAMKLGNYAVRFKAEGKGTRITINDEQGPISVDALINVSGSGQYTVKSTLIPASSADAAIKNSLTLLGKADNQGRYQFNYRGVLPMKH